MIEVNLFPLLRSDRGVTSRIRGGIINAVTGARDYRVGLEIASDAVRACVVRRTGENSRVVRYVEAPLPPEAIVDSVMMNSAVIADELAEIRRKLEADGFPKHARVCFGVAGHSVVIKKITLPTMTEAELREAIPWEAEQYIPFDINDVWIDVQMLGPYAREQGEMEVLLVAAKKDMITDYATVIAESGFVPAIADIDCFALENAFTAMHPQSSDGTVVLINVGVDVININILTKGITAFTRDISMGGDLYVQEIQKQLNISYDEASALLLGSYATMPARVVDQPGMQVPLDDRQGGQLEVERIIRSVSDIITGEIQRSLDFYSATTVDSHIDRIYCSGAFVTIPGLVKNIETRSGVPVEVPQPATNTQAVIPGSSLSVSRFIIPFGLALRDVGKARAGIGKATKTWHDFEQQKHDRRWRDWRKGVAQQPAKKYQPSLKEIAQFSDLLGFLLKNGVPILDALEVLASPDAVVGGRRRFREAVGVIRTYIGEGKMFADGMEEVFTGIPIVVMVVRAGEVGGDLCAALTQIAEHFRTVK